MSPGFLIQCDANGHVSYMRKKVASQTVTSH